jgi:hypothetical protein
MDVILVMWCGWKFVDLLELLLLSFRGNQTHGHKAVRGDQERLPLAGSGKQLSAFPRQGKWISALTIGQASPGWRSASL